MLFQVYSRSNSGNGNPFRLAIVFDDTAKPYAAYESRSSRPNIVSKLEGQHGRLPDVKLTPTAYAALKDDVSGLVEEDVL